MSIVDKRVIHCDDQILNQHELKLGEKYVLVIGEKERIIRLTDIKTMPVGNSTGGMIRFDFLDDNLIENEFNKTYYLTDAGVVGYQYRGNISWHAMNYVRKLRFSDYNSGMRLKTANRLLMVPNFFQENAKRA